MGFMQLHPNIRIRILTSFLMRAVGTMIFPFMAIYFSTKLGQGLAGILLIVNIAAQILASFYGGYLADLVGRKKVMVFGQSAQLFAYAMMALANSPLLDSAWLTFFMMLLQNISNGLVNPAADAMLIDVSTKENRTLMYSLAYWSTNLSISIGAMFGGMLFASHRFLLFSILTSICVVTLALTVFAIKETYKPGEGRARMKPDTGILRGVLQTYKGVMHDKLFLLYSLGGLLVISLEFQTSNYVGVRLEQEFVTQHISFLNLFSFDLTGIKVLSLMQIENTVMVVVLSLFMTKWIKKFNDKRILYMGFLLYTVGYSTVGYTNSLILIVLCILLATIGELMHVPMRQSYLAEIVREDARSSYMAVNGLVFQGAKVMGALGISVGSVLSSGMMAILYLIMGLSGIALTRYVLVRMSTDKRIATPDVKHLEARN